MHARTYEYGVCMLQTSLHTLDAQNITDEKTRLFVRYPEMLFLAQDHGPVFKLGVRANF